MNVVKQPVVQLKVEKSCKLLEKKLLFKELQKSLRFKNFEIANVLGVSTVAVEKYRVGKINIPERHLTLLHFLANNPSQIAAWRSSQIEIKIQLS